MNSLQKNELKKYQADETLVGGYVSQSMALLIDLFTVYKNKSRSDLVRDLIDEFIRTEVKQHKANSNEDLINKLIQCIAKTIRHEIEPFLSIMSSEEVKKTIKEHKQQAYKNLIKKLPEHIVNSILEEVHFEEENV